MYKVEFSPRSLKSLKRIPKKHSERLMRVAEMLGENPYLGKKLKGELSGQYSVQAWPYRLIYKIKKKKLIVYVIDLGHRQGIYS